MDVWDIALKTASHKMVQILVSLPSGYKANALFYKRFGLEFALNQAHPAQRVNHVRAGTKKRPPTIAGGRLIRWIPRARGGGSGDVSASSTGDACVLCADPPSCAPPRGHLA